MKQIVEGKLLKGAKGWGSLGISVMWTARIAEDVIIKQELAHAFQGTGERIVRGEM